MYLPYVVFERGQVIGTLPNLLTNHLADKPTPEKIALHTTVLVETGKALAVPIAQFSAEILRTQGLSFPDSPMNWVCDSSYQSAYVHSLWSTMTTHLNALQATSALFPLLMILLWSAGLTLADKSSWKKPLRY